jgi:hypothetical protein
MTLINKLNMDRAKTSTDGQVHEKNGYQRYYCEKGTYYYRILNPSRSIYQAEVGYWQHQ